MYKVLYGFVDSVEGRDYKAGDEFIVGEKTNEARLTSLLSFDNNLRQPLIAKVEVEQTEVLEGEKPEILEGEQPEIVEGESSETHEPLESLTIAELKDMAQERGLEFKVKSTKSELIAMLREE